MLVWEMLSKANCKVKPQLGKGNLNRLARDTPHLPPLPPLAVCPAAQKIAAEKDCITLLVRLLKLDSTMHTRDEEGRGGTK